VSTHTHYLNVAYQQAQLAYEQAEVPIGAILVEHDKVIASAGNLKEQQCCVTSHAEILCINQVTQARQDWRLVDCVLYTTLEPCVMCAGAIIHARIKTVVCGALDYKGGAESVFGIFTANKLNHQCGFEFVEHRQSQQLLKDFFKQRR
tara:strand:- start:108 stop:551 length:444 start_codon:yes stop_codon:yes gene_type:complete